MENVAFEIETLVHPTSHNDVVYDILKPTLTQAEDDPVWCEWQALTKTGNSKGTLPTEDRRRQRRVENVVWRDWWGKPVSRQDSGEGSTSSADDIVEATEDHVVNGEDVGDLPTKYTAKGLLPHEVPVIGTYVAKEVVAGFKYRVRALGTQQYLFNGEALNLERIGMGYGKRLTFTGETLNHNSNYFWSDSQPDGYGFGIEVLTEGLEFDICDEENRFVGTAYVESVDLQQQEVSCHVEDGAIEKEVAVTFACTVQYSAEPHGLMSLRTQQFIQISGIAVAVKAKRAPTAVIKCVKNIALPYLGLCSFYPTIV